MKKFIREQHSQPIGPEDIVFLLLFGIAFLWFVVNF